MRIVVALLVALVVAVPALAGDPDPYVRTCSSSAYGDLGRGWRERAVVAGHVAFVGMKQSYTRWSWNEPAAWPAKVLVVVDPHARPTVSIAARSRGFAALGYNEIRHDGSGVELREGTTSVRFKACGVVRSRESWNRGTQFPGYFLVSRRGCVHVEVATQGRILRRVLHFGVARCG